MSPWTLLLLSIASLIPVSLVDSTCHFPDYAQQEGSDKRRWMYRVHSQGSRGASMDLHIVTFINDVMTVTSEVSVPDPPHPLQPYRRQCRLATATGFVCSHEAQSGADRGNDLEPIVMYICMQLRRVSDYVVLLRESLLTDTYSADLCGNDLFDDSWPLVSFTIDENFTPQDKPDHWTGGYEFTMTNGETGEVLCPPNSFRASRLELGCFSNYEMHFAFSSECDKQLLLMDDTQYVQNLGTWDASNFTFIVLKKASSMNLWCLRFSRSGLDTLTANLFLDVSCTAESPLPDGIKRVDLNLTMRVYENLCQDISQDCRVSANDSSMCQNAYQANSCVRSCEACTPLMVNTGLETACNFSQHLHGPWIHSSSTETEGVLVMSKEIYFDEPRWPLMCMATEEGILVSRYPLVSLGSEGCLPSFTCIEFQKNNPGLIKYRLGRYSFWPDDVRSLADPAFEVFCGDERFDGWFDLVTYTYIEHKFRTLVYDPRNPDAFSRTVGCNIGYHNATQMHFQRLPGASNELCQGVISVHCVTPSIIDISNSACTSIPSGSQHQCMSSTVTDDGRLIVITATLLPEDSPPEDLRLKCWMFSATFNALYTLPWAECDENTFNDVENTDKYRDDLSTYTTTIVQDETSLCFSTVEAATEPEPETTPEPEPETEATTWENPYLSGALPCKNQQSSVLYLFTWVCISWLNVY